MRSEHEDPLPMYRQLVQAPLAPGSLGTRQLEKGPQLARFAQEVHESELPQGSHRYQAMALAFCCEFSLWSAGWTVLPFTTSRGLNRR